VVKKRELRYRLKAQKNLFSEITAGNYPNLGKEMNIHVQEAFMTRRELFHVILQLKFQE
jgi:hypothetical protein